MEYFLARCSIMTHACLSRNQKLVLINISVNINSIHTVNILTRKHRSQEVILASVQYQCVLDLKLQDKIKTEHAKINYR